MSDMASRYDILLNPNLPIVEEPRKFWGAEIVLVDSLDPHNTALLFPEWYADSFGGMSNYYSPVIVQGNDR